MSFRKDAWGVSVLLGPLVACLAALCPWRNEDDEWFHLSALLLAMLLGALLLSVV